MSELTQVMNTDFSQTFLDIVVILVAFVFVVTLAEKVSVIIGKPFKWIKKKDDDHKILMDAVATMKSMQETHAADKKEVNDKNDKLENVLTAFMDEMKVVISDTQNEIKQLADNRINDRKISIEREKRLNDRIDAMVSSDESRDEAMGKIGTDLKKLTSMFVEKEVSDLRWTIINFATNIAAGKECTQEAYNHCFKTYEKYERILEENGLENGQVEISMEVINESYKEKLKHGFK